MYVFPRALVIDSLLFSIYPFTSKTTSISVVLTTIIFLMQFVLYIQLHGGHIHQRTFQN